jgi:Tol biopolymer transport system component
MNRSATWFAGSVMLFLVLLVSMFAGVRQASSTDVSPLDIRTDGTTVVWSQDGEINAESITSGDHQILGTGYDPDVSLGTAVWTEDFRLRGMNLSTGKPLLLLAPTDAEEQDFHPSIEHWHLAWLNRETPESPIRIMKAHLYSPVPERMVERTLPDDVTTVGRPVVSPRSGDVLWGMYTGADAGGERWELWLGGTMLDAGPGDRFSDLGEYDVGGNWVVYDVDRQIHLLDINYSSSPTVLSTNGANPTTDGRYVFWEDWGSEAPAERSILGFDTATNSYIGWKLNLDGINLNPMARSGAIVWSFASSFDQQPSVRTRYVQDILPSAPQPDPGKTDPKWLYFDKTGHYLSSGFKDFWLNSGGLPVFGYPLTREYDELNGDLGEYRTVQYTERQRFEYHPAYAGTPYETSLGRLGWADAERRGFMDREAFRRVEDPGTAGVDYFEEAGHTLRGPFRDYWRSHGLEFGDAGVSYRESLALFGYPISEEFVEPGTGLKTQYFERAVFEYHPDNPDQYKVLLRRLGAEEIKRRGWRDEDKPELGRIAFVASSDIWVMRGDGSGLTNLTKDRFHSYDPVWSPDGSEIMFTSYRCDGGWSQCLYVMNADGTGMRLLTEPGTGSSTGAWSPDGKRIAYISTEHGEQHLYVMNADGSNKRQLTELPGVVGRPTWSPDGQRIAYATNAFSGFSRGEQIHVINADGSGDTPLTLDLALAKQPAWSPDGSRIAFIQGGMQEGYLILESLQIMDPDGSGKMPIATVSNLSEGLAWSPDSSGIALHRENEVVVVDPGDAGDPQVLMTGQQFSGTPSLSPDGSRVALGVNYSSIVVVNRDGTDLIRLPSEGWLTHSPAWAPR